MLTCSHIAEKTEHILKYSLYFFIDKVSVIKLDKLMTDFRFKHSILGSVTASINLKKHHNFRVYIYSLISGFVPCDHKQGITVFFDIFKF